MKYLMTFLLTFGLLVMNSQSVSAHTLKTDGEIGAVMHTDPDDDVPVGKPASIFFDFKDKSNKFNPGECDCVAYIAKDGKQLYSQPIYQSVTQPSLDNAIVPYTFPEKGTYQLTVIGKPQIPNAFQPFTLNYTIEVGEGEESTGQFAKFLPFIGGGIAIGVIITLILYLVKKH